MTNKSDPTGLSVREALAIARICRVNHAGEFGAIRIYGAQVFVARRLWPDVVPDLEDMLADERRHCDLFRAAMPARQSRPCRVMRLWSVVLIWLSTWGDSSRKARALKLDGIRK